METGVPEKVLKCLQEMGVEAEEMDLSRFAVDDFFSAKLFASTTLEVEHSFN